TSPPLSPLFNSVEERMMGFERSKESHLLDLTSLLDWATGETPLCSSRLQKKEAHPVETFGLCDGESMIVVVPIQL
ncbi:unnamed protein product, partial [Urochloa humidicola]